MNVLILQGPNLNLLGFQSSKIQRTLTLNKLNKAIKSHFKEKNITFKTYQTHKQFHAINILQRNRTWADGILFIPTSWARYEYTLLETISLINIPTSMVYFDKPLSIGPSLKNSIFIADNIKNYSGTPIEACIKGIENLLK
tara:strand:- start:142 stop:564 length:423 start_codon:yes stop_codon:yes gene_type:complete